MNTHTTAHPNNTAVLLGGLRRFNLIMGFFHFLQAILMLALSSDFSLPVTTSFLSFNETTQTLYSDTRTFFDLRIGPAVALFLFMN